MKDRTFSLIGYTFAALLGMALFVLVFLFVLDTLKAVPNPILVTVLVISFATFLLGAFAVLLAMLVRGSMKGGSDE